MICQVGHLPYISFTICHAMHTGYPRTLPYTRTIKKPSILLATYRLCNTHNLGAVRIRKIVHGFLSSSALICLANSHPSKASMTARISQEAAMGSTAPQVAVTIFEDFEGGSSEIACVMRASRVRAARVTPSVLSYVQGRAGRSGRVVRQTVPRSQCH